jgi:hypothetical protein
LLLVGCEQPIARKMLRPASIAVPGQASSLVSPINVNRTGAALQPGIKLDDSTIGRFVGGIVRLKSRLGSPSTSCSPETSRRFVSRRMHRLLHTDYSRLRRQLRGTHDPRPALVYTAQSRSMSHDALDTARDFDRSVSSWDDGGVGGRCGRTWIARRLERCWPGLVVGAPKLRQSERAPG